MSDTINNNNNENADSEQPETANDSAECMENVEDLSQAYNHVVHENNTTANSTPSEGDQDDTDAPEPADETETTEEDITEIEENEQIQETTSEAELDAEPSVESEAETESEPATEADTDTESEAEPTIESELETADAQPLPETTETEADTEQDLEIDASGNQPESDTQQPVEELAAGNEDGDDNDDEDDPDDEEESQPEEELEISTCSVVEAVLFAADEPIGARRIVEIINAGSIKDVKKHIRDLNKKYKKMGCAFRIEELAGGYQMLTKSDYNPWLSKLIKVRSESKLTAAAMETLAIIAYKQPLMRVEIENIRGVAAGEMIRQLIEKGLVKIVGRAEELGRPLLYGTTQKFLDVFGLASVKDLPQPEDHKKQ